jgi:hypothetical protein
MPAPLFPVIAAGLGTLAKNVAKPLVKSLTKKAVAKPQTKSPTKEIAAKKAVAKPQTKSPTKEVTDKKTAAEGMSSAAKKEAAKKVAQDAREEALKNAKTEVKDGVKKTSYPYVDPKKAGDIRDFAKPTSSSRNAPRLSDEPFFNKKGGLVKSSVSKRADGCVVKGKTKGRFV